MFQQQAGYINNKNRFEKSVSQAKIILLICYTQKNCACMLDKDMSFSLVGNTKKSSEYKGKGDICDKHFSHKRKYSVQTTKKLEPKLNHGNTKHKFYLFDGAFLCTKTF